MASQTTSKADDVRVGLIGFGLAGAVFHAPLVSATKGLRLAAVVTSNPERAHEAQRAYAEISILKTPELIGKYNEMAEDLSEDIAVLPYGHVTGKSADDHLHIDLGYMLVVPREISEDRMEQPQEARPRFAFEDRRRRDRRAVAVGDEADEKS